MRFIATKFVMLLNRLMDWFLGLSSKDQKAVVLSAIAIAASIIGIVLVYVVRNLFSIPL